MPLRALISSTALVALTATFVACGNNGEAAAPGTDLPVATDARPENIVWAHDASDLEPDPAVIYGQLENGFRYVILENDTPSGTAAMRLRINAGSLNERDDQAGISHFLEHMAFNGSANVPEGEMVKILERFGLAFGPDTNAFTSFDQIQYQLDLPSVEDELLETGFFLMRETASNLTLAAEAIDKERGVIAAEERLRNSYSLRRFKHQIAFLAPDTSLADRLPIGDLDVIATAPPERFRELYDAYYRPENASFIIVGDIDVSAIEARISETFGDWTGRGDPGSLATMGTMNPARERDAAFFYDPDVPTLISIANVQAPTSELDTSERRRRNLVRSIGNTIVSRRFATLARQTDAIFLNAGASQAEYFDIAKVASIDLTTSPENWEAALALGEQELRRALTFGFTEAELTEQLANIRTGLKNAVDQAETRSSTALSASLANAINDDTVFTTPASGLARFETYADTITPEEVHAAFKAQWEGNGGPLIHLSSNTDIEGAREKILAAYDASKLVEVSPPTAIEQAGFAYTEFGSPGEIRTDSRIEDLGIRTLVFDNNVRLNLKPTDFEEGRIRISLRVGRGLLEFPSDKDGLAVFMSVAFPQGGLEAHSVDELQTILAGRSVSSGITASADTFGATATTTPDDLLLQMQVLAANLTAPGFRPEGRAQYEQLINVFYPTLDAEPSGIVQRDVDRILHNGDIRFGLGAQEDLAERSFDELKPVLERAFQTGAIEIGVVGDFEEQAAIAAVAATFGALPERRAQPLSFASARNVTFPQDRSPRTLNHAGPANKALALVYWPTDDNSDQRATYTRSLLRAVMRLKLTDALREDLGATYSPSASSSSSNVYPGYGYISASSEVNPRDLDTVFEAIMAIATEMRDGNITEDELQRARQPILENIEEGRENNRSWLGIVDEAQTAPAFLDRWRTSAEVYSDIALPDLVDAANTYLTPDAALQIRIVSSEAE